MADVVQQRRGDQLARRPGRFGEVGALQRMLRLRHRLAEVCALPLLREQAEDVVDDAHASALTSTRRPGSAWACANARSASSSGCSPAIRSSNGYTWPDPARKVSADPRSRG